jgi:hypothetical protein
VARGRSIRAENGHLASTRASAVHWPHSVKEMRQGANPAMSGNQSFMPYLLKQYSRFFLNAKLAPAFFVSRTTNWVVRFSSRANDQEILSFAYTSAFSLEV